MTHNHSQPPTTAPNHPQPYTTTYNYQQPSTTTTTTQKSKNLSRIFTFNCNISIMAEYVFDTDTDAAAKHKAAAIEKGFLK